MAENNVALSRVKDELDFLGEKFKVEHKEVLLDPDWQMDLQRAEYRIDAVIYFIGASNFERARMLAHQEADKKHPEDAEKNRELYASLISEFIESTANLFPKESRSSHLAWRSK